MQSRPPIKANINSIARQFGLPEIDLDQDRLEAVVKAGPRLEEIKQFVSYLNSRGIVLAEDVDGRARTLEDNRIYGVMLEYLGVTVEEARVVADYVVRSVNVLKSRGE